MTMSSKSNLGKKLRLYTKSKVFTPERPAYIADVSNNAIIDIKSGIDTNPTGEMIYKVAKALKIPVEELLE